MKIDNRQIIIVIITCALLVFMSACESKTTVDGTSAKDFSKSIRLISRELPADLRSEFIESLKLLQDKYGHPYSSLDRPSSEFLLWINGMTVEAIITKAKELKVQKTRNAIINKVQRYRASNKLLESKINKLKERRDHLNKINKVIELVELSQPSYGISPNPLLLGTKEWYLSFTATNHSDYVISIEGFEGVVFKKSGTEMELPSLCIMSTAGNNISILPDGNRRFHCKIRSNMAGAQNITVYINDAHIRGLGDYNKNSLFAGVLAGPTAKELTTTIESKQAKLRQQTEEMVRFCMKVKAVRSGLFKQACRH